MRLNAVDVLVFSQRNAEDSNQPTYKTPPWQNIAPLKKEKKGGPGSGVAFPAPALRARRAPRRLARSGESLGCPK